MVEDFLCDRLTAFVQSEEDFQNLCTGRILVKFSNTNGSIHEPVFIQNGKVVVKYAFVRESVLVKSKQGQHTLLAIDDFVVVAIVVCAIKGQLFEDETTNLASCEDAVQQFLSVLLIPNRTALIIGVEINAEQVMEAE